MDNCYDPDMLFVCFVLHFYCMEKSSVNILLNISVCVPQKKKKLFSCTNRLDYLKSFFFKKKKVDWTHLNLNHLVNF